MLTDIIAERFLKKLGTESYNERISIVEKYNNRKNINKRETKIDSIDKVISEIEKQVLLFSM